MQYDAECKSHIDNFNEFGAIDWNILNEALLDDDNSSYGGNDGFSTEQSTTSPIGQDLLQKQFLKDRKFSSEESKTKTSTKRKRDNLQDQIKALEEQNKIMRRALAEYNITPDQLILTQNTRLATFRRLIDLFNNGDVLQLTNFLLHGTTTDCLLLTPSLFQELHGRNAAIQFWTLILEAFPDGLFQLSDTAYEENGFVATRFTFTGTKVSALPSDVLLHRWGKFRDMMTAMRAAGGQNGQGQGQGHMATQETQAATFRDLCTNEMVPTTTSGGFVPRGQHSSFGEIPELSSTSYGSEYLPHHSHAAAAAAAAAGNTAMGSNESIPIKSERFSPTTHFSSSSTASSTASASSRPSASTFSAAAAAAAHPFSIGVPTLRLTGYMTVTFNSMNLINRYIFVWNTASLIGQILGLSNGDLEAMSQYFNTPSPTNSTSK